MKAQVKRSPIEQERTKKAFGQLVRAKEVATKIEWPVENCVYKIQEYPRGTALFSPSFFHDVYVAKSKYGIAPISRDRVFVCRVKIDFEFFPNGAADLPQVS